MLIWVVAYLFWINVIALLITVYIIRRQYYSGDKLSNVAPVLLMCVGGIWGVLCAKLIFTTSQKHNKKGSSVDDVVLKHTKIDNWCTPIVGVPELPSPALNRPHPISSDHTIEHPILRSTFASNQIIVLLDTDQPEVDMARFAKVFKTVYPADEYSVGYYNTSTRVMQLIVPSVELENVLERLPNELPELRFMLTYNEMYGEDESDSGQVDEGYIRHYYNSIQCIDAWKVTQGSSNVTVAVIDSFFDLTHPALRNTYKDEINIRDLNRNVAAPKNIPEKRARHGSVVAGIAVGNDMTSGYRGVAPNCSWMPIALGAKMNSLLIVEGVMYAIYNGADVINISLGSEIKESLKSISIDEQIDISNKKGKQLQSIWDYIYTIAEKHNSVIVWAAGNDDVLISLDAAKRSDSVINVSAVDVMDNTKTSFSNYGNDVKYNIHYSTLSAPGLFIYSSVPGGLYRQCSGTSMAAPFVAGAVALMKSINKSLRTMEIIRILQQSGLPSRSSNIGPLIQIKDALSLVKDELVCFDDWAEGDALIGEYISTETLQVVDANDHKKVIDQVNLGFNILSRTAGVLTIRGVYSSNIYTAKLSLVIENGQIFIHQLEHAKPQQSSVPPIRPYVFECKASDDKLLLCTVKDESGLLFTFNIRRVK